MNLLAIESTTNRVAIALKIGNQHWLKTNTEARKHAQVLLPMINDLLKEAAAGLPNLDGIVYSAGPGSFTGLRIGLSVAKGLSLAHNLPLYPVGSLATIAHQVRQQYSNLEMPPSILTLIDARMQELYWCYYDKDDELSKMPRVTGAQKITVPDNSSSIVMAGVDFEEYLEELSTNIKDRVMIKQVVYPDPLAMIDIINKDKTAKVTAETASLVYVRNQVTHGAKCG